jgi:hypothetical protein
VTPFNRRFATVLAMFGMVAATSLVAFQVPDRHQVVRLQPVSPRIERLDPVRDGRGAFEPLRERRTTVTVRGIVQNTLGHLMPLAGTVLIRSLADGTVAGRAEVDALAQFSTSGFGPGTYTGELVGPGGAVLATTAAFSAQAGETVQLVPVVPTTSRLVGSSTWESSTSAIVGAAAGSGILAYSKGQPVTPQ